jgi:murein DD-endopeptidase MepM/ murein hydrolase activator NlpD
MLKRMNSSELDCVKFTIIMSSKAEKTSHHSPQQPRLSIFFRNPLLLKIVAWLGSLSFIGSTGVVWADLKPISTSQTEAQELVKAARSADTETIAARPTARDTYGPYLPVAPTQSPVPVTPTSPLETLRQELPNREVPTAVAPASASISPTGTIVRPQHTDLLTSDNYTVSVQGADVNQQVAEEFVTIPVPAPLSAIIPTQPREVVTATRSQIQPSYIKPQSTISQSVPTTSIQSKPKSEQANNYRSVPEVTSLPTTKSISQQVIGRGGTSLSRPTAITPQYVPLAGIKPTTIAPIKPSVIAKPATVATAPVTAVDSIRVPRGYANEISIPAPRTQRIEVQPVAQLPKITTNKVVPTVPAIPSVRPAGRSTSPSTPVAFDNTGMGNSTELIYPLSSPAPTTSSFGWRTHPITGSRRFHSGVDIGAPMGAPVVAAGSGIIVSAGWNGGYGKAIVIQHNGVQQTLYGHLSEIFVQPGQRIEQGTVIARVGSTGNSTGPHLHFETKVATADGWVAVDPGDDIKYALDNLRRSMPFAQRDLPPGYN